MRALIRLTVVPLGILCSTACFEMPTDDSGDTAAPITTASPTTGSGSTGPAGPCEPLGQQPGWNGTGTLSGRVTSPSGTVPILSAIAEVEAEGETAWMLTSCDSGRFVLELPPGSHQLQISKGRWSASRAVQVEAGQQLDLGDIALDVAPVGIAVVQGEYDDIGALIADAGIPYDPVGRPSDLLDDPASMADYDVIFLNCGTLAGRGTEPYTAQQATNVRAWLEAGGTLYASDWEHDIVELALPEALHFEADPRQGSVALVTANVLDRDIQTILQKETAELQFNMPSWARIQDVDQAFPLVSGATPDDPVERPMAALMPVGELGGKAVYTSFHNERQITEDMEIILYEMILSL